jgi:hypothetical protein
MGDATDLLEYLYERNTAAQGSAAAPRTTAPTESSEADVSALGQYMGPSEPLPPHLKELAAYALEQEKKLKRK